MSARRLALAAALALGLPACGDGCDDDEYRDGEICFAEDPLRPEPGVDGPLALRAADFDGDGTSDLLVVGAGESGVAGALLRGDGVGGLSEPRDVGVSGCSAYPVEAELDGDGASDLLFATCSGSLLLYRADGAGGFAPPVELLAGIALRNTAVADIDGDGRRDIVVLGDSSGAPALSLLRGAPGGLFAPPTLVDATTPGLPGFRPSLLVAGRVERDGAAVVVLAEPDRNGGLALARGGPGGIGPVAAVASALRPAGFALRDLDDDDRLDLVVVDGSRAAIAPLLGPDLREGPRTELRAAPRTVALGHLDGDGSLDAAVVLGATVELWRGVGDGAFVRHGEVAFPAEVAELALPDLNGDGRGDLVAGLFPGGGLHVRRSGP